MKDIKIEKAIEIEDGKTYVVELEGNLTPDQIEVMKKIWREATNSKLIILNNAKLARIGEDDIREQIAKEIESMPKIDIHRDFENFVQQAATIARGKK